MFRKLTLAVGAVGAVVLTSTSLASGDPRHGSRVLHLTTTGSSPALVDSAPAGPSPGDRSTSDGELLFRGVSAGRGTTDCVVARVRNGILDLQCVGTLSLRQGQITAQGRITFDPGHSGNYEVAITGGTGAYTGAGGTIELSNLDVATFSGDLTVRLRR